MLPNLDEFNIIMETTRVCLQNKKETTPPTRRNELSFKDSVLSLLLPVLCQVANPAKEFVITLSSLPKKLLTSSHFFQSP